MDPPHRCLVSHAPPRRLRDVLVEHLDVNSGGLLTGTRWPGFQPTVAGVGKKTWSFIWGPMYIYIYIPATTSYSLYGYLYIHRLNLYDYIVRVLFHLYNHNVWSFITIYYLLYCLSGHDGPYLSSDHFSSIFLSLTHKQLLSNPYLSRVSVEHL